MSYSLCPTNSAESVGCYGHPLVQTPNMDALAAEGVRFDQCHVQHSVCTPSRCSMMTGWYPHVRGHRTLWHMLRPDEPNLLRYLKQKGYTVHWYGKNDLLAPAASPTAWTWPRAAARGSSAPTLRRGRSALLQFPLRAVRRRRRRSRRLRQRAGGHRLPAQQAARSVHPLPAAHLPALSLFRAAAVAQSDRSR
ncbi:MAG: sulfatase-like hydrolase/transferase [Caldilineaceae bacterium]